MQTVVARRTLDLAWMLARLSADAASYVYLIAVNTVVLACHTSWRRRSTGVRNRSCSTNAPSFSAKAPQRAWGVLGEASAFEKSRVNISGQDMETEPGVTVSKPQRPQDRERVGFLS